jgi:hypothetical protein
MGAIAVGVVLLLLLAWFFWPSQSATDAPPRGSRPRPGVDEAELEAAERDVQQAQNEQTVRDWGPGTGQKPLP